MKSSAALKNSPSDEKLDRVFYALCDPTRRSLLARLTNGPARVTELAEPFDMSLAAVGKHLRVLEKAELIHRNVEGRNHHLSFSPDSLQHLEQWLSFYRVFWKGSLSKLARYAEQNNEQPPSKKQ